MRASSKAFVRFLRRGANVKRYHTSHMHVHQNLGHHQHGVAMLMWRISEGELSSAALMAGLTHDMGEQITGDIPSPAKRMLGIRDQVNAIEDQFLAEHDLSIQLDRKESWLLEMGDALEGYLHTSTELFLGNRFIVNVHDQYGEYIRELIAKPQLEEDREPLQRWGRNASDLYHAIVGIGEGE